MLQGHIKNFHLDLYKKLVKEKKWMTPLPGMVSQVQSMASKTSTAVGQVDKFDEQTFHQFLLKFIVVND